MKNTDKLTIIKEKASAKYGVSAVCSARLIADTLKEIKIKVSKRVIAQIKI